jgi:HK97 family phage major capsid protein
MNEIINSVLERREAIQSDMDTLLQRVNDEKRTALTVEEDAAFEGLKAERDAADVRIAELRKEHEAREAVKAFRATLNTAEVTVGKEPETYRKGGSQSYFRDLAGASIRQDRDAMDRLVRNDREVRAINTTDGGIGEFVPPLWMVSDYIALARAQRVIASEIVNAPLPGGTDTISLPKVNGGTSTAEQSSQNSTLSATDATSTSVSAGVATIGGIQIMSLQLLEQSPINMDDVILADLASDLATRIDSFVISNNATNKVGLLSAVASATSVTYTSGSPTAALLYSKIADGVQKIHTNRYAPATKIFMHPRRWAYFLAAVDSQSRPLVVPNSSGPWNVYGVQEGMVSAGYAGTLMGLPVYLDANIPTNLGAGTNEDRVIIVKHDDIRLYESAPKAEVFRETKADQGSVLVRLYEYTALHASRYRESIAVVAGTGLVAPTF